MENIGLLNAIGEKIKYLSRAQEIVAQNVANADTPGYKPKQLTEVDFASLLGQSGDGRDVRIARTQDGHLIPGGGGNLGAKDRPQKVTYEVAPAGNAVVLEEQLVKANQIRMEYELAVNLYTKNMNLLRTALGTNR